MRNAIAVSLFVIVLALSSCGSFQHMHYRHVKKVDADYVPAFRKVIPAEQSTQIVVPSQDTFPAIVLVPTSNFDSATVTRIVLVKERDTTGGIQLPIVKSIFSTKKVADEETHVSEKGLHRDWSLLIAALFIITGIVLLGYMGALLFVTQISLLVRILGGIFIGLAAGKMLVEGISIFVNRFRSRGKNYKEN